MTKEPSTVCVTNNKASRKISKKDTDCSKLSARICAIIAEKKRRKSGQRRICQGMCFSLPTPTDPFNDKHGKHGLKKLEYFSKDNIIKNKLKPSSDKGFSRNTNPSENPDGQNKKNYHTEKNGVCKNNRCPSAFLIMCLNTIQQELELKGNYSNSEGSPFFCNRWGVDFWMLYSSGKDVFDKNGSSSMIEKIAWIASTAADDISEMERKDIPLTIPFILFLVPTVEKAIEARTVCKPLKELGIHTVSLHENATINHQIRGLKRLEPEFIISTPSRLLELLDLNAVDISEISVMVIVGGDAEGGGHFSEMSETIRQSICGNPIIISLNGDKSTKMAS